MKYKLFGKSGLRVSELCLGTMTFGTEFGWGSEKEESRKVFDRFVEAGGNFIDTANYYTKGTSETFLADFMGKEREKYVLATKYTLNTRPEDPNAGGNHRKNLVQSIEGSLRRLKTDYIDLYWVHAWDFTVSAEEVMRSLDDMVRAGKILHIGLSDTPAWIAAKADTIAKLRGWTPLTGLQLQYSLIERSVEREFPELCHESNLATAAWSPLGMGILTGKYIDQSPSDSRFSINPEWGKKMLTEKNNQIAKLVVDIANEIDRSPAQVAINWVRQRPGVVIPIIGASKEKQIIDNLAALEFSLTNDQMKRLDEASAIDLGFPNEFVRSDSIRKMILGEHHEDIILS